MAIRYRFGERKHKRSYHVKGIVGLALIVLAILGGIMYYLSRDQFESMEGPLADINIGDKKDKYEKFDEKYFKISLPEHWRLKRSQVTPTIQYQFQSGERFNENRFLTIYIDTIPPDFAVTHLVPVTAEGNRLTVGGLSPRCSDFAGPDIVRTPESVRSLGNIEAKWDGVSFLCGLSYFEDYIVGTSSAQSGINKVVLKGSKQKHTLFFVYEDQNNIPKPEIFQEALNDFELK